MIQQLLQSIVEILNKKTASLFFDKTFPSVVYGKDSKNPSKYKIVFEGKLRNIHNGLPCDIKNGTWVWVTIPSGNLKDMYISGLRK